MKCVEVNFKLIRQIRYIKEMCKCLLQIGNSRGRATRNEARGDPRTLLNVTTTSTWTTKTKSLATLFPPYTHYLLSQFRYISRANLTQLSW